VVGGHPCRLESAYRESRSAAVVALLGGRIGDAAG
jgi:hypothetical protein